MYLVSYSLKVIISYVAAAQGLRGSSEGLRGIRDEVKPRKRERERRMNMNTCRVR